jgi:hypothetical protein
MTDKGRAMNVRVPYGNVHEMDIPGPNAGGVWRGVTGHVGRSLPTCSMVLCAVKSWIIFSTTVAGFIH